MATNAGGGGLQVIEHAFLASMLAVVGLEGVIALYIGYRVYRRSEQIEGVTAAIYLEARKILSEHR
jgi:hypothetical protein